MIETSAIPPSTSIANLKLTLKACPVITAATIGICSLTQIVAGWFGIELPDQANIDIVLRQAGWNWRFALLCAQIVILMPVVEEFLFRYLLFRLPTRYSEKAGRWVCPTFFIGSSAVFSAAHYIFQPFPDAAFIALFFFGLAQCWLYRRTGRIWCAMMSHAVFNVFNLAIALVFLERC